jgi:putative endonuclease
VHPLRPSVARHVCQSRGAAIVISLRVLTGHRISVVGVVSRTYHVYILASASGVLYTGITNSLQRRVAQHRLRQVPGFTAKYNVTRLVYYELFGEVSLAIAREKEIKAWRRSKRVAAIESVNPKWADLAADWFPAEMPS